MDYELALADFVGFLTGGALIPISQATDHIFGFVLTADIEISCYKYFPE